MDELKVSATRNMDIKIASRNREITKDLKATPSEMIDPIEGDDLVPFSFREAERLDTNLVDKSLKD